jgi:N-acetylglucosaminyldiphosphoundecaprenol N-acetyl-beta-D-mannosaminyltransferase
MTNSTTEPFPTAQIDGLEIQALTFEETVAAIAAWAADGSGGYVCTPNVDYVVKARRDKRFRAALEGARLRVPDGMGIIYGARIAGAPLRGSVTGRLLPEAVGRKLAQHEMSIALFGGEPGTTAQAAAELRRRGVSVSAAIGPPMGFAIDSEADSGYVQELATLRPQAVFVGLGAPKQELWMARHAADIPGAVVVGVGAAIDVLAGLRREAPRWMTRAGLEWAYRLVHEPRRLARRYLWDDPRFFLWMLEARLGRARHVSTDH